MAVKRVEVFFDLENPIKVNQPTKYDEYHKHLAELDKKHMNDLFCLDPYPGAVSNIGAGKSKPLKYVSDHDKFWYRYRKVRNVRFGEIQCKRKFL